MKPQRAAWPTLSATFAMICGGISAVPDSRSAADWMPRSRRRPMGHLPHEQTPRPTETGPAQDRARQTRSAWRCADRQPGQRFGAGNTPADRTRRCAFVARQAPHADDTANRTAVRPHTQGNPLEGTPNGPIAERPELLGIGAGFIGRQVRGPSDTRAGIDACGILAVAAIDGGRRRAARQTIGAAGCCDFFRRATGGRRSAGSAGTRATAVAG